VLRFPRTPPPFSSPEKKGGGQPAARAKKHTSPPTILFVWDPAIQPAAWLHTIFKKTCGDFQITVILSKLG
jgi:hypothetical protein